MLNRILMVAVISGALCGLAITAMQMAWSVPLILAAEAYEAQPEAAAPAAAPHGHASVAHDHGAAAAHDHGAHDHGDAWAPEDGFERTLWTAITNVLLGVGGGLVIAAFLALRSGPVSLKTGLAFGLAAFASVSLAPALGLPPELPGMPAAELEGRQVWWFATAIATAIAIAVAVYAPGPWKVAALALLAVPHLIGAPQPGSHETAVPAALIEEFILASLITAAVFWIGLGGTVGALAGRLKLTAPGQAAA
jgi:cobalt transporter subunit CbtA